MRKATIIMGANFGDEGKGLITDYVAAKSPAVRRIVVRFNGGAQAGHTVIAPDGKAHVFSHFGSGAFSATPTFLSKFFVLNPILMLTEYAKLIEKWPSLRLPVFADPDCLVTTFADMVINQVMEERRGEKRHGSCGVGFNETIVRSEIPELRITYKDLISRPNHVESVLYEICTMYALYRIGEPIAGYRASIQKFMRATEQMPLSGPLYLEDVGRAEHFIFEGAQGLLLSQDNAEYAPHLTRSYTGCRNALELCEQLSVPKSDIEKVYVSRTYLTRHGAGPLPGEDPHMQFEDKTNAPHPFQGSLRFAPIDYSALSARCRADAGGDAYTLALTHCDQLSPARPVDIGMYSKGPCRSDVTYVRKGNGM
jgi:adenylosuccinate synthase